MAATIAAFGDFSHYQVRRLGFCVGPATGSAIRVSLLLAAGLWLGTLSGGAAALDETRAVDAGKRGPSELVQVPRQTDGKQPSFVLDDLSGARHDLSNVPGRLVLVHFFATWCEPCREELPALQRLTERGENSTPAIFAISVGEPDERVRRFFQTIPVKFPVLLDRDRAAAKSWRVQSLPTTYVLDRQLEPRLMVEGEFAWDRLKTEQLLDALRSVQDKATGDGG